MVDLAAATSRTVIIAQTTSLLGQLGEWLIPSARAKMAPETAQRAVLSDDGRHLYITGRRLIWIQRADGSYTEEVAFSGLRVIATDELRELARHDLPVDHVAVAPDGQTLLLTGIAIHEGKPVGQGLFLLDAFEPRRHMQLAPKALVTLHGFSHDGRVGYVVLERDGEGVLQAIDLVSDQVIAERGLPWGNAGALLTVE